MINEKYSYKNFTNQSFKHLKAEEFNNSEIIGSCFYQFNNPNSDIFPPNLQNIIFIDSNLDNILIPNGVTLKNSSNKKIKRQNDFEDWILDESLMPIEPILKEFLLLWGFNVDPKNIPVFAEKEEFINKNDWDKTYGIGIILQNSWFTEIPQIINYEERPIIAVKLKKYYLEEELLNDYINFDSKPNILKNNRIVILEGINTIYTIKGKAKIIL